MLQWLLQPPSEGDLVRLLSAWRLWLAGAVIGSALGAGLYTIAPPPYRAQATVVVDQNVDLAYPTQPDREVFYFLARETLKLQEVAFSDDVLQMVSEEVKGVSVSGLRAGQLKLSQPGDGPWHLWAEDPDPEKAQALAAAWAKAFVKYVHLAVDAERALPGVRTQLAVQGSNPDLEAQISTLEGQSRGISTYTEVTLSEGQHLPVERTLGIGVYAFAGSAIVLVLVALAVLFSGGEKNAR